MSVVGPRPPLRREVDTYNDQVRRRLLGAAGHHRPVAGRAVAPTCRGRTRSASTSSYVENWSITNDLLIAVKTIRTVATGSGAY